MIVCVKPYLDVVCDEHFAQVEDGQHGGGAVVRDAVALEHVLGDHDLPGQPVLVERGVQRQEVRQVAGLETTETCNNNVTTLNTFCVHSNKIINVYQLNLKLPVRFKFTLNGFLFFRLLFI